MSKNNGGPAFPTQQKTGGAFLGSDGLLHDETLQMGGMSLRDWYAGQALAGLIACPDSPDAKDWPEMTSKTASFAYDYADAMIAVRDK